MSKEYTYFTKQEWNCKCGKCSLGLKDMNKSFIKDITLCRKLADVPFVITSAVRCEKHNKAVGGAPASNHLATKSKKACAVDIKYTNAEHLFNIIKGVMLSGKKIRVLVYPRVGFVHLDNKSNEIIIMKD